MEILDCKAWICNHEELKKIRWRWQCHLAAFILELLLESAFQGRDDLLLSGEALLLVDGVVGELAAESLLKACGCRCIAHEEQIAGFFHDIREHEHDHVQLLCLFHLVHLIEDGRPLGREVCQVHDLDLARRPPWCRRSRTS